MRHSAAMDRPDRAAASLDRSDGPALELILDAIEETVVVCRALREDGAYTGAEIRYANRFARERWVGAEATELLFV